MCRRPDTSYSHRPIPRTCRLTQWIDLFVDFLVTKHGLAEAMRSDSTGFATLHTYFLDRLVPVCDSLLDAAARSGEIADGRPDWI